MEEERPYILPVPKMRRPAATKSAALEFYSAYTRENLIHELEAWIRQALLLHDKEWPLVEAQQLYLESLSKEDAAKVINSTAYSLEELGADIDLRSAEYAVVTAAVAWAKLHRTHNRDEGNLEDVLAAMVGELAEARANPDLKKE
jgi:hypothetical protein